MVYTKQIIEKPTNDLAHKLKINLKLQEKLNNIPDLNEGSLIVQGLGTASLIIQGYSPKRVETKQVLDNSNNNKLQIELNKIKYKLVKLREANG